VRPVDRPADGPRASLRARVIGLLGQLADGSRGTTVVVRGEAGIGKTAFTEAVVAGLPPAVSVAATRASRVDRATPFGPLLNLLDGATLAEPLPDFLAPAYERLVGLAEQRPHTHGRTSPLQTVPDQRVLLVEGFVQLLAGWAEQTPLVVVIDDLHWCDDATVGVLARATRLVARLPLALIVATRPPPRAGTHSEFVALLRDGGALDVGLGPLDDLEIERLVRAQLGAPPGRLLRAMLRGAGGNPFLILEALASLQRDGRLLIDAGIAEAAGGAGGGLPGAVVDRMAAVDDADRVLLQVAAMLGEPFSFAELGAVVGRPPTDLLASVSSFIDTGLLVGDGPSLRFRHDLVAGAIRASMSASLRASVDAQIAEVLAARGAPATRVAAHYLAGAAKGDRVAAGWLQQAAGEVAGRSPAAAAELLERAAELLPETAAERDEVVLQLVDALFWSGRVEQAIEVAGELGNRPLPRPLDARRHEIMARALALVGRLAEAVDHAEQIDGDGDEAWSLGLTAILRLFAMDLDGAIAAAEAATALAHRAGADDDPWAETMAYGVQCFVLNVRGYHRDAARFGAMASAVADRSPGREAHRLVPLVFHGIALQTSGDHDEAQAVLRRGERLSDELGTTWATPFYHYARALGHWDFARWDELLAECEAGLGFARAHDITLAAGFACAAAAAAHLFQYRPDDAVKLLDEGDAFIARGGIQYGADWLAWIRALHLEATGDTDSALALLDAGWQVAQGMHAGAALSLFGPDLVRLALVAGDERLAGRVLAELEAGGDGDRAIVDAGALAWRGVLDRAPSLADQAVATLLAVPRPVMALQAQEAALLAEIRSGDHQRAAARLRSLIATADQLGCPMLGDRATREAALLGLTVSVRQRRVQARAGWGSLTGTERMVAAGKGNAAIADELGISRRTVESHLYHAFAKLAVDNRTALAVVVLAQR